MQTRSSNENSLCQYVCQTRELWQKSAQIFIPYERSTYSTKKNGFGGGDPIYLKFWVRAKSPILNR